MNLAKIVIIGNSLAGFSCCEALVKNSQDNEITVIAQEKVPAYKAHLLTDFLKGEIKEKDIFLCDKDFYAKNKINFLKETKVYRIDTKKKLVILKDNAKINYDYLVIASGQKVNIPDIQGKTKDGVFAFYSFEDIKGIKDRLMLANAICILGEADLAIRLAEIFLNKDKEVKVISKIKPEVLPVSEKLEWINSLELSEIIGEGAELKAIKLNSGKAIGVDLVLFVGNLIASAEFLKETDLQTEEGYVLVNDLFQTNFENIFSCGSVCRKQGVSKVKSWEVVISEGQLVAKKILEGRKSLCQQTQ